MTRCTRHLRIVATLSLLALGGPAWAERGGLDRPLLWAECQMADPARFRPAGPEDYAGDAWRHWSRLTGSDTPWEVRADIDGDGLEDRAWVAIHRERPGLWMVGVDYGRADGGRCRVAQYASSDEPDSLPALLAWPLGVDSLVCHGSAIGVAARCDAQGVDGDFRERPGAAFIMADAGPVKLGVVFERWMRMSPSREGLFVPAQSGERGAVRRLHAQAVALQMDMEASRPPSTVSEASVRIDAAFATLAAQPRYTRHSVMGQEGEFWHVRRIERFQAPDRFHRVEERASGRSEMLRVGERVWNRNDDAPWFEFPPGMAQLMSHPVPLPFEGPMSARDEAGGAVLVGRAQHLGQSHAYEARLDSQGRLASESHEDMGGMGALTVRYDYTAPVDIAPPPGSD